jgi:predicted lipoprotein with Yx(FWY)xxD motif
MRSFKLIAAGLVALAFLAGNVAEPTRARESGTSISLVKVAHSASLGKFLTTSKGLTLYYLTVETHGKIACSGSCVKFWPPYQVPVGAPMPGALSGFKGKFAVIVRPDRMRQLTFDARPLYTFAGDKRPGQTKGQGVKHVWFAATLTPAAAEGGRYGSGSGY